MLLNVFTDAFRRRLALFRQGSHRARAPAVRIDDGAVCVRNESLPLASIVHVGIAPLYDVAPADDLWMLRDREGRCVSFFGKDPGAKEVLAALESSFAGFDVEHALELAHRESVFEQEVTVWKR
jgi:hypothetical protein